jgi:hypothetical protein
MNFAFSLGDGSRVQQLRVSCTVRQPIKQHPEVGRCF